MLVVFLSFMPSLAERVHVDTLHVGIILSVGIFLAGLLQVPFGWLSDKLDMTGRLIQISVGTCFGMFSLFLMPLAPGFPALLAAGALMGVGAAVSMPPLTSSAISIGHQAGMGAWMGIFSSVRSLAFAVTPIFCGLIMDILGIDAVFYLFGLLCLLGTLAFIHYALRRLHGAVIS
jgi:MFS family permease